MYPMETPEPKWINQAHLLYEINYVLLPRGEDQTVTVSQHWIAGNGSFIVLTLHSGELWLCLQHFICAVHTI